MHLGWDPKQGQGGLHTVWVKRGRSLHIQGEKEKRRREKKEKGRKEKFSENGRNLNWHVEAKRAKAETEWGRGAHKWSRRIA